MKEDDMMLLRDACTAYVWAGSAGLLHMRLDHAVRARPAWRQTRNRGAAGQHKVLLIVKRTT